MFPDDPTVHRQLRADRLRGLETATQARRLLGERRRPSRFRRTPDDGAAR